MNRTKKIALSMAVIALLAAFIGSGTFASFNASTTNASNSFSSGSLVLSNTANSGKACLSTGGGSTDTNANEGCDAIVNLADLNKPGQTNSGTLVLKNVGEIDATSLNVSAPGFCKVSDSKAAYHGTGDICKVTTLVITFEGKVIYKGSLTEFTEKYKSESPLATGAALKSNASAKVEVSLTLDGSADNTMQGRVANFGLTWQMVQ